MPQRLTQQAANISFHGKQDHTLDLRLPSPLQPPTDPLIPHSQLVPLRAPPQAIFSTTCEGLRLTLQQDHLAVPELKSTDGQKGSQLMANHCQQKTPNRGSNCSASTINLGYNSYFVHQRRLWYMAFISRNPNSQSAPPSSPAFRVAPHSTESNSLIIRIKH